MDVMAARHKLPAVYAPDDRLLSRRAAGSQIPARAKGHAPINPVR